MTAFTKPFDKSIGIIGSGQLARMLCLRGREMGLKVHVLSDKKDDPASQVCTQWHKGNPLDLKDLKKFADNVDIVTFESEFIPGSLLDQIETLKRKCLPNTTAIKKLQDRWPQKELLWDFKIPTSPFIKIGSKDDLDMSYTAFKGQMVLKSRFGGYDGFGTFVIKSSRDLSQFKLKNKGLESHFIAEKFIQFKNEKSLIIARNTKGEFYKYPLVTTVQRHNQCYQVYGPSEHPKEKALFKKITQCLNAINYVGVIAFELFDTGKDLIVNEVAPRVHNSGHITLDAFNIDQFELHLRALLGLKFPDKVYSSKVFLMQNLSGETNRKVRFLGALEGRLYWYEKNKNRPRRKMGHINYIGNSLKNLQTYAQKDLKKIVL